MESTSVIHQQGLLNDVRRRSGVDPTTLVKEHATIATQLGLAIPGTFFACRHKGHCVIDFRLSATPP